MSLQLYCMYLTRTSRLNLVAITKPKTQVTPYVWLSAVLLVAMKLSHGLGAPGTVRAEQPLFC